MTAVMATPLSPLGVLTTREKLWCSMRQLKIFTTLELSRHAGLTGRLRKYDVKDYLRGLVAAGIVSKSPAKRYSPAVYKLERDMGVDAPRVRRDGSCIPENAQTRMWRAMKVLKVFSAMDLVAYASLPERRISEVTAADYCHWLTRGSFLRVESEGPTRWRFVRDTGAKAPQILRVKQLLDVNTGEIVAGDAIREALDAVEMAL